MSDTKNLNKAADSGLLQPRLVRLVAEWRSKADHCEVEIARSKKKKPTLHLSTEGRICYEQAARTLRQCADLLESEANIRTLQEHLGHTDVKTTEIYTHATGGNAVISPMDYPPPSQLVAIPFPNVRTA